VQQGGHDVPETTIRRRYHAGLSNFFRLYQPLAATWRMYDNSNHAGSSLIAAGQQTTVAHIRDAAIWQHLAQEYGYDAG